MISVIPDFKFKIFIKKRSRDQLYFFLNIKAGGAIH